MRGNTRTHLSNCTRNVHTALHHDPVLSRLVDTSISRTDYMRALSAFAVFYTTIETQRKILDLWPEYSLDAECAALQMDLGTNVSNLASSFKFGCRATALGGLYVAYGAAFGRAHMRKNCVARIPESSHAFLKLSNQPDRWRSLVDTLDTFASNHLALRRMETGATIAFQLMNRAAVDMRAPALQRL